MLHPESFLNRVRLQQTLITMLDSIMPACAQVEYCLVGTSAALLHGVELPAADVDILVKERTDVDTISRALSPFRCLSVPAWLPDSRQYYASWEINGVEVEFSTVEVESDSDTIETFGRGPWVHSVLLPCGPYAVPTAALELRLITELARNRPERYQPIIRYMQQNGCDIDLLQRGMDAAGLPDDRQVVLRNQIKNCP